MASHDPLVHTTIPIGNNTLPSPVLVASGTFGYGSEYQDVCDYSTMGGIVCKTVTKEERAGNPPPRIYEVPSGSLNSIGLANAGMLHFASHVLPLIHQYQCPYIVNIAGSTPNEFVEIITYLQQHDSHQGIWGWELNLGCPNVSGGTNFGKDVRKIAEIVSLVRAHTTLPVIVKLPPNVDDIGLLGKAAEESGADAVSAINTFVGMWIDIAQKRPVFARHTGGLSGSAIFPAALALVYELARAVSIPVIGIGGISDGIHAIQFLLAGASAVQVGSHNFRDPQTATKCNKAIVAYCQENNITDIQSLSMNIEETPQS